MAAVAGRSLNNIICQANGKVKCNDISLPTTNFKTGKMAVLRLGNSNSFSVGIQQTVGHRLSKKIISLKPYQFKLNSRPSKLTITFSYNKTSLSIVEANEAELKTLVDLLNTINEGKYPQRLKEMNSRSHYVDESLDTLQQNGSLGNDENQPLNSNIKRSANTEVQSSEANQFLSNGTVNHSHSPSRLESTTQLGIKRKYTPFSSGSLKSFHGSKYSSPSVLKKPFTSPLHEKSPTIADKNFTKSSSSFYGTNSPTHNSSTYGRKTIGLPKNSRQRPHLSRESSSFSFKASTNKPTFASSEVQLTGFSNLGNTCYMNAILQSLLGIESFAQDICNRRLLERIPAQCLYKCTYGLLACKKNNCNQDLQRLHLKKFKKTISQAATRFSGHLQHDAHEFLCQVLDQLKDDVNALQTKSEPDETTDSPAKDEVTYQCPVRRSFECGVMHTITCKGCGESLNKEEIHHVFSLDLPALSSDNVSQVLKKLSIDKLIEDYFEEEELEYCCEECGCKEAIISHRFSRLPRVLILHLKRYDFNTNTDKHGKKQNDIQINRFIDIGKLCNSKTTPPFEFKVEKVKFSPVKTPRIVKQPPPDSPSDNDFVNTPTVRRKLHHEFDSTKLSREKKVPIIDSDHKDSTTHKEQESRSGSKKVEKSSMPSEFSDFDDFDDICDIPLDVESSKSGKKMEALISMSEQQQIEWAKKESLKCTSVGENENEDSCEQVKTTTDSKDGEVEHARLCNKSSSTATKQSVSEKMDMDARNVDVNTENMDMDCSDEDLLTTCDDTHGKDSVDDEERDHEVCGLKGGAPTGSTKVNTPVRHVTYISDDSDQSGLDDQKHSGSLTKSYTVNSSDSSDTSFDEGVGSKKHSRDNSLCSLMDRRPVLSKFSGDLLIETDDNESTSKKNSRGSVSERQFVKSVTSPFNAKFQPPFKYGKNYSDSKYPVKSSPSSHRNRLSQTPTKPFQSYRKTPKQNHHPKKDVIQPDFDDEEVARAIQRSLNDQVPSSDDEQVKKAIELSIQESRMDYSFQQQDSTDAEKLDHDHQARKTLSPQHDLQNNSIDSGYQGDEDHVSYPYRLVSVVSHLGDKSFAGHYISDVYDCTKDEWTSYDDLSAAKVDEHRVRYGRSRDGYIFFYLFKQCIEAVKSQSQDVKSKK